MLPWSFIKYVQVSLLTSPHFGPISFLILELSSSTKTLSGLEDGVLTNLIGLREDQKIVHGVLPLSVRGSLIHFVKFSSEICMFLPAANFTN